MIELGTVADLGTLILAGVAASASTTAKELQKARGLERQTLRYQSYGKLWAKLRPLAIYDDSPITNGTIRDLSWKLTAWYFSACGGLLLTSQARDFYFALQDLLLGISEPSVDWSVDRKGVSAMDSKAVLRDLLEKKGQRAACEVFEYFSAGAFGDWQEKAPELAKAWRKGIKHLGLGWAELNTKQRFALLQQTGSILRTTLTTDLESRTQ